MNPSTMSLDSAMKLASEAFLPYSCVTCTNAGEEGFKLAIMSIDGEKVLQKAHLSRDEYSNPVRFFDAIEQTRHHLEDKGRHLNPWKMPFILDDTGIPEMPPNY
ncbi:hypothetical protein [Azomonas macrocytogenes]|uniref:Uncharacterized protein n=1 Tax=Azomonas macrocytogenes TaxID=69962 RepID=A0A839T5D3_AZOMA|nr:hypothetical protein [Azomonas macrocytogenes]MBB3103696.1 hypothetical protein [Azomonas macrocytogenes]